MKTALKHLIIRLIPTCKRKNTVGLCTVCVIALYTLPGRLVHRYTCISCFPDKLLLVIQKINLAVELSLDVGLNFKLKICEPHLTLDNKMYIKCGPVQ